MPSATRPRPLSRRIGLAFAALVPLAATVLAVPAAAAPATPATPPGTDAATRGTAPVPTTGFIEGNFVPAVREVPSARPGVDARTYAAMKSAAERATASVRPAGPSTDAPPTVVGQNYTGTNQPTACECAPPDTHGAIGISHYVQIVNSRIVVYDKVTNAALQQASLNSFFQYTGPESSLVFDPRAVYDPAARRFVVSAEAAPEAGTADQYYWLGVSKTADPTGAWWIYKILVNSNPAVFFDYPQLALDRGSVIATANVFGPSPNIGTPYFFKKGQLYNGQALVYWYFPQLSSNTLTPNMVLDRSPTTYIMGVPVAGARIVEYAFQNTAGNPPVLASTTNIPVPSFSVPPPAAQPGTSATLDTLDSRFVNSGTQLGDRVWNVHTVAASGLARPRWYEFNTTANTVVASGTFSASGTSDDWNASLAVNQNREIFVTWSSTDIPTNTRPQMRVSGKQPADATIPAGVATFTSTSVYTSGRPQRWGDYSSVSLDPVAASCGANRRVWGTNEIVANGTWSTRISRFGYC